MKSLKTAGMLLASTLLVACQSQQTTSQQPNHVNQSSTQQSTTQQTVDSSVEQSSQIPQSTSAGRQVVTTPIGLFEIPVEFKQVDERRYADDRGNYIVFDELWITRDDIDDLRNATNLSDVLTNDMDIEWGDIYDDFIQEDLEDDYMTTSFVERDPQDGDVYRYRKEFQDDRFMLSAVTFVANIQESLSLDELTTIPYPTVIVYTRDQHLSISVDEIVRK